MAHANGKTTLVRQLGGDMRYITLDDPNMAALAQQDPVGLIRQLDRAIIDEVQRAPQLMLAFKMAVDEDQRPGRFLLTGSANVLALPQMADSLAGRMEVHTLLPLSQAELQRRPNDFCNAHNSKTGPSPMPTGPSPVAGKANMVEHALAGGYPEMRRRATSARRQSRARDYITTLVERDVRDIAHIEHLSQMPRLLSVLATQCGQLLNATQTGAQLGLNTRTLDKYITIPERLF